MPRTIDSDPAGEGAEDVWFDAKRSAGAAAAPVPAGCGELLKDSKLSQPTGWFHMGISNSSAKNCEVERGAATLSPSVARPCEKASRSGRLLGGKDGRRSGPTNGALGEMVDPRSSTIFGGRGGGPKGAVTCAWPGPRAGLRMGACAASGVGTKPARPWAAGAGGREKVTLGTAYEMEVAVAVAVGGADEGSRTTGEIVVRGGRERRLDEDEVVDEVLEELGVVCETLAPGPVDTRAGVGNMANAEMVKE